VADLPIPLDADLTARLGNVLDIEGKIPRALEALGPVSDRDVLLVDGLEGGRARQLGELGARVTAVGPPPLDDIAEASVDVLVSQWTAFRGADPSEVAEASRVLRPGGRLLVVHDYGRDDISRILGDRPEYDTWSRRDGPFLRSGFRIRVIHCWWTFGTIEEARTFLVDAFGDAGAVVGEGLTRPRLSYNIAVYHRTFGASTTG